MSTVAIIQARMGSTRLPGKTLADIHGKPLIQRLLERVQAVPRIDEIIVATTVHRSDDVLESWAKSFGVHCFRGSEADVLDRYYQASRGRNAELVVRLTADDPLKDPALIARTIDALRAEPAADYASTSIRPTFPEGLDCEAMRIGALERAHRNATLPSEREHVTSYIWTHPDLFRILSVEQERDLSAWRWTVDKPEDLEFVRAIYGHFRDRPLVPFEEIVAYVDAHPGLLGLNAGTARNEGYLKSLAEDSQ
jgi:spore coat polysaccharide biosynthesis protein SpsF